jgi:serine/threonine protein phosphatase 1
MKNIIIIGDIHGCYFTFLALLGKIKSEYPNDEIVLCGDLVDRGPSSAQIVQWVIDKNIKCVQGNHEQMMYTDMDGTTEYPGSWGVNGGHQTVRSYKDEHGDVNNELLQKHAEWMKTLPLYLEYPDIKNKDGRYLVVSHASLGSTWKYRDESHSKHHFFLDNVTWNRNTHRMLKIFITYLDTLQLKIHPLSNHFMQM